MKRLILILLVLFIISVFGLGFSGCQPQKTVDIAPTVSEEIQTAQALVIKPNEPIFTEHYLADPSAHVFDGKLYIYPSHDSGQEDHPHASVNDGGAYQMYDYHVLSIDSFYEPCVDHGAVLTLDDIPWADKDRWALWAPDAAYKNDMYYLYFPAKDAQGIFRIGVATSDRPEGPFTAEETYIDGSFSIDPSVFVDADGAAYMFFGGIWGGQLESWTTGTHVDNPPQIESSDPALGPMIVEMSDDMLSFASTPKEIVILNDGKPISAGDEARRFFEAAWVHKYQDKYYLSYSTGSTHFLVYAVSDTIEGPYEYKGHILQPVVGWTTHHSIVEFNGEWYLFYHDASLFGGKDNMRCIKYAPLIHHADGSIQEITP